MMNDSLTLTVEPATRTLNASQPCSKCSRRENCRDYRACTECTKSYPRAPLDRKMSAPSLKVFALRTDEILPIEPAFVAVDCTGIKFFTQRPVFKYERDQKNTGRWTTGCYEDQIACLRYDYLEGIFDTSPYRGKGNTYNFDQMITPL